MRKLQISLVALIAMLMAASFAFAQDKPADQPKKDKIQLGGRVQFRYETAKDDSDTTGYPASSFNEMNTYFKRVRLAGKFTSGDGSYGGVIELGFENEINSQNTTGTGTRLIYGYGWIKPIDMIKITAGQMKIDVSRETNRSSGSFYTGEINLPGNFIGVDLLTSTNDIGVKAQITPMKELDIFFGITNGYIYNHGETNKAANSQTLANSYYGPGSQLFSLRAAYQVMGKKVSAGQEAFAKGMGLNVGLFGAYSSNFGTLSKSATIDSEDKNPYNAFGLDVQYYMNGLVANFVVARESVKYTNNTTGSTTSTTTDKTELPIMVELGYNIPIGQMGLMPAFRFEYAAKTETDMKDAANTGIGAGLNLFWRNSHKQRFALIYMQKTIETAVAATATTGNTKVKSDNIMFEYQFAF